MKLKDQQKLPPPFLVKIVLGFTGFLRRLERKILPPQAVLINHILGDIITHNVLHTAAVLGIPDKLKNSSKNLDNLAQETGTSADSLNRMMRVLSAMGICKREKEDYFKITKLGKFMCTDEKNTMLYFSKLVGKKYIYNSFFDMVESVRNGKSYYLNNQSEHLFEWLEKNPAAQIEFFEGMTSTSAQTDDAIISVYDFSNYNSIVDVAGGSATQLLRILQANPNITKGILLELPLVVGLLLNSDILDESNKDRVHFQEGNFFDSIPMGYELYFMKSVLQDWDDESAIKILSNCRAAMKENSKLIIAEMLVKNDNVMHFSKILDLSLLALMGGRLRTEKEFLRLFQKTGLKLKRIIPTAGPTDILEVIPG